MMPTCSERQDLARQFDVDVARMQRCLQAAGKQVDVDDIVYAWADYSDGCCAVWLTLPENEDVLLATLLQHLPPSRQRWYAKMQDAGDDTGDCIPELPDDLLAQLGWKDGDTLRSPRMRRAG
ncbi:MAG TPA: hypothetical protein VJ577_04385 [Burkholderiaceae bacterium]|nr:hypothetical protein [Burkholderiaceae bacterium]